MLACNPRPKCGNEASVAQAPHGARVPLRSLSRRGSGFRDGDQGISPVYSGRKPSDWDSIIVRSLFEDVQGLLSRLSASGIGCAAHSVEEGTW